MRNQLVTLSLNFGPRLDRFNTALVLPDFNFSVRAEEEDLTYTAGYETDH